MLNKKLILLFVIGLLSISSLVLAQTQEIKEYKVQKGDTLWDIAKKELNDPFLWPKIWKENPDISNPDLLMPGQTVKIPLYLLQKEVQKVEPEQEPVAEAEPPRPAPAPIVAPAPPKPKPFLDANLFISSGYIADAVNEVGMVVGSPLKKNLLGLFDHIYINTKDPAKVGDKYFIARKKTLYHPVTKSRLGELVQILGVAEVSMIKQGETIAKIAKSYYEEVLIGNLLIPYAEMPVPVVSKPYRRPNVEGYVVDALFTKQNNAMFDIIYIDKGKNAGLEVGDLLRAISKEKQLEGFTKEEHKYPKGIVQIIKVYDTTSVAIVRESIDAIVPGYLVIQYD